MTDKLVVFTDRRTGQVFTLAVPLTSAWHALLAPVTEAEIRTETPDDLAARERYREAGGVIVTRPPEARR